MATLMVALVLALIDTTLVHYRRITTEDQRTDLLSTSLARQAGADSKATQQLLTTTAELATVQKGLATVEGNQAPTLDTTAVSAKVLKSVFTIETSTSIGSAFRFSVRWGRQRSDH